MSDSLIAVLELRDEIIHQRLAIKSLWKHWRQQLEVSDSPTWSAPTESDREAINAQAAAMMRDLHKLEDSLSIRLLQYHDETGDATIPIDENTEQRIVIHAELGEVINLEP